MDFGTIFIALIGFTIAMLLFPQYLESMIQRNVDLLKEDVKDNHDIAALGLDHDSPEYGQADGLWNSLVREEKKSKIKRIRRQRYVPYVTVLITLEVALFSYSSYKIARGQRMPGFIEDVVIGLSILLILMTIYISYRVITNNRYFNRYLSTYETYVKLFPAAGKD